MPKGTQIVNKSSWGKREIFQTFGIEVDKSNYNSISLAKIVLTYELKEIGFGQISSIVTALDNYFSGINTVGYQAYLLHLKSLWLSHENDLEFNSAESEFTTAKRLFNKMKSECKEGCIIGKNQAIKALYLHTLDLLEHV